MLAFLCALGLVVSVAALCTAASIPGVGTDQACEHTTGCPKRTKECSTLPSPLPLSSLSLSSLPPRVASCSVVCANSTNDNSELWKCVENVWERESPVLKCVACPPFPPVPLGRCKGPVTLGFVVNLKQGKCTPARGCPLDYKFYAKGQLFQDLKACETRLKVCQQSANVTNLTTANSLGLTPSDPQSNLTVVHPPNSSTIPATRSSRNTGKASRQAPPATNASLASLAVFGAPVPTPELSDGSRRAQELAAARLSVGMVQNYVPLIQGPWGGAGVDVDVTMQELEKLNPTFDFLKNHEFEQYPVVVSDHFARLLYDDENMLVRIVRQ